MRLAAYEPDIPQNLGALIRLSACLGVPLDIVGPCGFPFGSREMRRVALDYDTTAELARHESWQSFRAQVPGRLVLLTTQAKQSHVAFQFDPADTLLLGRESAGVTEMVRNSVDAAVRIPLQPTMRSLNVAIAAAMVLGEALRQTGGFITAQDGDAA